MSKKTKETSKKTSFGRNVLNLTCKAFLTLLFFAYLIIAVPTSYTWVHIKWYRQDPINELANQVDKFRAKQDIHRAFAYIRARPKEEHPEIIEILISEAPKYEPFFYYELAALLAGQEKFYDAYFWETLGRYRMRYDALRCGEQEAIQLTEKIKHLRVLHRDLNVYMANHPELQDEMIRKVLKWDEENPPMSLPYYLCEIVDKTRPYDRKVIVEESSWPTVLENLRFVTRLHLEQKSEEKPTNIQIPGE